MPAISAMLIRYMERLKSRPYTAWILRAVILSGAMISKKYAQVILPLIRLVQETALIWQELTAMSKICMIAGCTIKPTGWIKRRKIITVIWLSNISKTSTSKLQTPGW